MQAPAWRAWAETDLNCLGGSQVCVCADGWMAVDAGWLHCSGFAVCSGCSACPIPPFQWLRAQQISSCEPHCAFCCCHWRLVRQQHFHPCE